MVEDERTYGAKLGARIVHARGKKNQPTFAKELGVSKNTLLGYEKGHVIPDVLTICKMCEISGVDINWIVSGDGQMQAGGTEETGAGRSQQDRLIKPSTGQQQAHDTFDSLGMAEGMGLLAQIYSSADNIYIRAINANLMAFADAVKTKARAVLLEQTINQMQAQIMQMSEKLLELELEVGRLRHENGELKRELRASSGHSDPTAATG